MTADEALIVPIRVDALVLNDGLRATGFRRWRPSFKRLKHLADPEDPLLGQEDISQPADHHYNGVYLQWRLPDKLCEGVHDEQASGAAVFPKIPNRWLVVRYSAAPEHAPEASCAWVVESDYLGPEGSSEFLEPGTLNATLIGRKTPLTGATDSWSEPDSARKLFLDVLGPGLMAFSAFQPYNEDVLSLHDPLSPELRDPGKKVTLSYCVLGWYSNPAFDPSRTPDPLKTLATLKWAVSEMPTDLAGAVFHGTALSLPAAGTPELAPRPHADTVKIAVGHSLAEAVSALHTPRPANSCGVEPTVHSAVLRSLLAGTLEHLGTPDLSVKTDYATHAGTFATTPTGVQWRTTEPNAAKTTPKTGSTPPTDKDLAGLNAQQEKVWRGNRALAQQRQRLVDLWRLRAQAADDTGQKAEARRQALDKTLRAALDTADARRKAVQGDLIEYAAQQEKITKAAGDAGLDLTWFPEPAYYRPQDPTIVIQDIGVDEPLAPTSDLPCRYAHDTLTTVPGLDSTAPADPPGRDRTACLPAYLRTAAAAAFTEFALLDRCARRPSADDPKRSLLDDVLKDGETAAALSPYTTAWAPPWSPLFLLWKAECAPIAYRTGTASCWDFDGTRFVWKGTGDQQHQPVANRSTIAPLPGFVVSRAMARLARDRPGDTSAYTRVGAEAGKADVISQSLAGFNDWYLQRTPMSHLLPTYRSKSEDEDEPARRVAGHLAELDPVTGAPTARTVSPPQLACADPAGPVFQPVRAGQMCLTALSVVDRFGQSADLMKDQSEVRTSTPPAADRIVKDLRPYKGKVVELPPRLLHPARLRIDAADPHDDTVPAPGLRALPRMAGWLVPSPLDRSLVVYEPDGTPHLELRHGPQHPAQLRPPRTTPPNVSLPATFQRLITYLKSLDTEDFTQVLATLDTGLTTIRRTDQDTASLAVLAGRPLALVRVRIGIELDGPPPGPNGWDTVHPAPDLHVLDQNWPLRLGEADLTQDGLIGYFLDNDTTRLRTHHITGPTDKNGRKTKVSDHLLHLTGGDPQLTVPSSVSPLAEGRYVTLIVDPWCAVHAVTDLLPVQTFQLPEPAVRPGINSLSIPLSTDPLLTPPDPDATTVLMPRPSAFHGRWQWAQRSSTTKDTWDTAPNLTAPDGAAAFCPTPARARAGFLQLREAFTHYHTDP
ncbi:hypothetical protein [Streptomyces sp. NPDC059788]|uniref:hypothetical protein n=1 Tax=Streptomyces sp. NPDC059788 TaxID=3346948 RepID=UPI0036687FAD